MKKVLLTLVLAIGLFTSSNAQRLGINYTLSPEVLNDTEQYLHGVEINGQNLKVRVLLSDIKDWNGDYKFHSLEVGPRVAIKDCSNTPKFFSVTGSYSVTGMGVGVYFDGNLTPWMNIGAGYNTDLGASLSVGFNIFK